MKRKIITTLLIAILVHILLAITLYYTLGWTDELPDELTARPTLVLLGTFASAVLWFNNFRVLFYVIDVSDRKSIDCKIILGSLGKMNTIVRKSFAIVLAICILLPSFIATAIAADVTDGFSQKASDSGYFCVDDLEKNSDILIKTDTDAVTFVEDGLQIYLSINTPYSSNDYCGYRDHCRQRHFTRGPQCFGGYFLLDSKCQHFRCRRNYGKMSEFNAYIKQCR